MVMAPSAIDVIDDYASYAHTAQSIKRARGSSHSNAYNGKLVGKLLTEQALKKRVEGVDADTCEAGEEDTFFVADLGEVYRQHLRWKMNLPRVKPHYGTFPAS